VRRNAPGLLWRVQGHHDRSARSAQRAVAWVQRSGTFGPANVPPIDARGNIAAQTPPPMPGEPFRPTKHPRGSRRRNARGEAGIMRMAG
jgi:hypothetical protein